MTGLRTIRSIAARCCDIAAGFGDDESGATAIEYAIIAAGVGAAVAATVMSLGDKLATNFYEKLAAMFP